MSWKTREGVIIPVDEMEDSHVTNVLKMLIRKYQGICLNLGARYACQINPEKMTNLERRVLLTETCKSRSFLKRKVAESCFGKIVWSEICTFTEL